MGRDFICLWRWDLCGEKFNFTPPCCAPDFQLIHKFPKAKNVAEGLSVIVIHHCLRVARILIDWNNIWLEIDVP